MRWIAERWRRLRSLTRRDTLESGLDQEIRFHIEQQTEKNLRAGMTPVEARRRAYVEFGGVERVKESTRDEFRPVLMRDSLLDLRYAVRALRRAPIFTLVATLTLALGIGATTAVFTVVNGVVIKPLPFREADALVSLKHTAADLNGGPPVGICLSMLVTYARENRSFEEIGAWSRGTDTVTDGDVPEEVTTLNVSAGTLRAVGVQPAIGRWFSEQDQIPGSPETVILMDGYWRRRFGGDRAIVGRQIAIGSRPRLVIGVMPASFRFLDETPDLALPVRIDPASLTLGGFNYEGIARLAAGVTREQATADLRRIVLPWTKEWPSFPGIDRSGFEGTMPLVRPLKQDLIGGAGDMLWVLMGTIGIVLVIACANVANLVLVRAQARQRELAIQTALGAGRGRIARQVLVENLVLGLLGGGAGLALAAAGLRVLRAIGSAGIPRLQEIALDPVVLIFTLVVSLATSLVFGSIPVVKFAGRRLALTLRAGGRGSSDTREHNRARNLLAVVQLALALILLVAAGLMIRTSLALRNVPPGFTQPAQVQLVRITIPDSDVAEPERVLPLQRAMLDRLAAIPGVTDVSFTGNVPMAAGERSRSTIVRDDVPIEDQGAESLRWFRYVAPGYFHTIGTRLIGGRDFRWTDLEARRPVAIISENLAREFWREPQAAIGKRIREGDTSPWREVIGVVGDVYDDGVYRAAPPIVYWPAVMESFQGQRINVRRSVTFAIRSSRAGSESLVAQAREAISGVRPEIAVTRVRTLADVYGRSLAATSFALVMLTIAASMALVLGIIGIYGVVAYSVTQRTREIGIRAALGASRGELAGMFLRRGVTLALAGVSFGLAGAAVVTQLMTSLLFATRPLDAGVYALVALGLVAVTTLASYLPARAAARVDPLRVLRGE
ncbi:MAG TPA: ABC transporter permease [Vicinamibacterales bacterium]|nr:ABC transporter permease [Vicinamibacterales bacterium]